MDKLIQLWRRLLFLGRRRRFDQEMEEEIQFHIQMRVEKNIAAGMSPEDARYDALRRFGNRTLAREDSKQAWLFTEVERLAQDVRYALRLLRRNPVFSFVAVLTLTLGIGANTAIFSVINAVLIRPLPYKDADRVVLLENAPIQSDNNQPLTPNTFLDWRSKVESFEGIGGWNFENTGVNLTSGAEPERVATREVTVNFFDTLGVQAFKGRTFYPDEDQAGKGYVAVISYGLWQRQFGANPDLVGQSVMLNGKAVTVVGVAPRAFDYPGGVDLWIPFTLANERVVSETMLFPQVFGRLKQDVSLEQARAEMAVLGEQLNKDDPELKGQANRAAIKVVPIGEEVVRGIRTALIVVFAAVGLVLLIACTNVANLLLARAAMRQKEMAIRAAIGAGRFRLIRQMLVESVLLSLIGGCFGALLAVWGIDFLLAISPSDLPRVKEIGIDSTVLAFNLAVSVLTGILFGLLPAIKASKLNLNDAIKEGGGKATQGRSQRKVGNALVVFEIALALILLIGAGLLIKSFRGLLHVDPGFSTDNVLTVGISLPANTYAKPAQKQAFFQQLIEKVGSLPQVESVAAVNGLPLGSAAMVGYPYTIEGKQVVQGGIENMLANSIVTPDYFRSMGIPLLAGRDVTDHDNRQSAPVVIINQTMARRYWPDEDPVGKQMKFVYEKMPREIVGVVGDTRQMGPSMATVMETYVPYQQVQIGRQLNFLVVRTLTDPRELVNAIRGEVRSIDGDLPIYDVKTMGQRLAGSVARQKFTVVLLMIFAAAALILAVIGVYGTLSYAVTRRTHEIGIRMALGAGRANVVMLILRQALVLVASGVALGLVGAYAATRVMISLLHGVSTTDTATFATIAAVVVAAALAASFFPVQRATKVDPMVALRYE